MPRTTIFSARAVRLGSSSGPELILGFIAGVRRRQRASVRWKIPRRFKSRQRRVQRFLFNADANQSLFTAAGGRGAEGADAPGPERGVPLLNPVRGAPGPPWVFGPMMGLLRMESAMR